MIDETNSRAWQPKWIAAGLVALASLCLSGCSGYRQAGPVDAPRAREALKAALDQWKNGADAGSLGSSSTPMVARDFEWDQGAKLLDYQVIDDREEGANLRVQVRLSLSEAGKGKGKDKGKGKVVEKRAWYVVGTSPSLTVFRDIMRR